MQSLINIYLKVNLESNLLKKTLQKKYGTENQIKGVWVFPLRESICYSKRIKKMQNASVSKYSCTNIVSTPTL